ncbi:MAG TPA: TonB-dependent receptor [Planctomycetota bacterium]|nr:TonB-dependent receptor [Planctomycetota bacterium]
MALCIGAPRSFAFAQGSASEKTKDGAQGLLDLTLEQLLDLEVTVAARHSERLRDVPAAVYVLTGDEIRRAGHTSIQEALRMVPGFHVAHWKSAGWDVTARGFTGTLGANETLNESFANQLLLIIDGVSVFSPAMAGIWWPLYDVPIDDIDRIEIIRGPAGTLWGTNAMNGVVNVITKHPKDTTGQTFAAVVGEMEQHGHFHEGGKLGDNGWVRAYVSYGEHKALPNSEGESFHEGWRIGSAGLRADWDLGERGRTRFLTTMYASEFGEFPVDALILGLPEFDDTPKNGGMLLGAWEGGPSSDVQRIQGWYSADFQKQVNLDMDVQNLDLEYTRHTALSEENTLTWGLGYRLAQTNLQSDHGYNDFDPEFRRTHGGRVFLQDELALPSLASKAIVGAQVEQETLGGLSVQPNLRWMWNATTETAIWAGISRAVRTPSREEVDNLGYDDPTLPPTFTGNKDFRNEKVLSHEIGVRTQLVENVQVDATGFYNKYDDLQTFEFDAGGTPTYGNNAHAVAYGAELALDLDLTSSWRLRSTYTYFDMDFESSANFAGAPIDERDEVVPKNHASIRSYYDLGDSWELDTAVYWSDWLGFWDNPSYSRVDARIGWKPDTHIELSLGVQDVQDEQHPEAGEDIDWFGGEVHRNIYASLKLSY